MSNRKPDLTYACFDGMWTKFFAETPAGEEAYDTMAKADPQGVVAFLAPALPGVLVQLRAAGLTVHKAKPQKRMSDDELAAALSEIDALTAA